ncbi:M13 family metallopeptidase [Neptunicella marina]|uniref:M13 family metallopeptidase n=1 Tax=Neptunicella marina TaxID=2125989 RepID=A0A8J6IV22_9ALTE|nr:M13 family metallopeptidase [Neptunicella marina]MBC3767875.1 M13 family metallopeptidase [Neptunicella marina]
MQFKKPLLVLSIISLFAAPVALRAQQSPSTQSTADNTANAVLKSGVDQEALDRSTRPQDDFYQFANGGWLNATTIPDIYNGYSIYHEVYEDAEKTLRSIIEDSAKATNAPGSEAQKVGDMYASWMDQATVEAKGLSPLNDDLNHINAINDTTSLTREMARFISMKVDMPFGIYVQPNLKKADEYAAYFYQDGLTLPDRDYYLATDNKTFIEVRDALPAFIKSMLGFIDKDVTDARAQAVFDLETQLATHQWSKVENRNDEKTYNPYSVDKLAELGDTTQWSPLLATLGLPDVEQVIISQPSYFKALDKLLASTPVSVWQDYLRYKLITSYASSLTKAVDDANFAFMSQKLRGQSKQQPRWKRGVSLINGSLGEAVGKLYVEKRFPAAAKDKMQKLVGNVLNEFEISIDQLDWMSDTTKQAAKVKLSKFNAKIGYPDHWRDYSALTITKGDHLGNVKRVRSFDYQREVSKLGKPIDKHEWFMTPQTVNAYYDPTQNEIVFPAARLQPPFFQLSADDAINYGAIGGVIGHEVSHGFDDSGSKYDGDGNLRNWWTEQDRKAFDDRTKLLVEQFNQYTPVEGMHINGELTLGENIGDLVGVTMAYKAYLRSLDGKAAPVIDGFTGPQRFFIGYAMSRKGKYKHETEVSRLASDPHSPLKYRVNGIYPNIPGFYKAFNVKQGDGMWIDPDKRVSLW